MTSNKKNWHGRGLTSLLTLAGFLVMSVTGIVLYVVPEGRIAYWTNWTFLGLTKTHWGDIHILSSLLFVAAGAVHIYFNWRPLMAYLRNKATGGIKLKKELAISVATIFVVTASAIFQLPPLSLLLDLNGAIKAAWSTKELEPPFGHAELLSLAVFAQKTDMQLAPAVAELEKQGLRGVDPDRSLEEIAEDNDISPLDIYRMIKQFEQAPSRPPPEVLTEKSLEETFGGTGMGNKTVADVAKRLRLDPQTLYRRLADKGIEAGKDETLKAIATKHDMQPLDVVKAAVLDRDGG